MIQTAKKPDKYYMLNQIDGAQTKTIEFSQQRWAALIGKCLQQTPGNETPDIDHIAEHIWHDIETHKNPYRGKK